MLRKAAEGTADVQLQHGKQTTDGKPPTTSCAQTNIAFFKDLHCPVSVFS